MTTNVLNLQHKGYFRPSLPGHGNQVTCCFAVFVARLAWDSKTNPTMLLQHVMLGTRCYCINLDHPVFYSSDCFSLLPSTWLTLT